jgi:hypothetical protein
MMRTVHGVLIRGLGSIEIRIFVVSLVLHFVLQVGLNMIMPFPYYSELSMADSSAYYPISGDLLPEHPVFSPNKYRRILLPLLVHIFFPWNRYLGFLVVDVVAVSVASLFFYKIAKMYSAYPLELTVLFSALPYLFAGAHLGYTEPLMVAGLLAGYYDLSRGRMWRSVLWHALALLAKEIAIFPILTLTLVYALESGVRKALPFPLALVPATIYYLALGLHWKDPLLLLQGDVEGMNVGFAPLLIVLLIGSAASQTYVPSWFLALNQVANVAFFTLLFLTVFWLRGHRNLFWYVGLSCVPLLFTGWSVVFLNWHVGRQGLIVSLSVLGFDRIMPWLKQFLWPILILMFLASCFQSLYWAKFFWFHKF